MTGGPRHRVLVVGTGSIGERHLRCFLASGRVEAAICETTAGLREAVARRYPVAASFASLGEALGWRPDATVICTPAHLHVEMARGIVAAGSHALVEKPLSTSFAGVADLAREAAAAGRLVGVAYVYRAHPAFVAARDAIRSGRFGDPVEVVAVTGQHFPTYRPAYREIYYRDRATGGGAVQDALSHVVNAAEWIVGPATRVAADAAHQVLDGVDVEDTVHVISRHAGAGEVLGSLALNQHQAPNENSFTVVCRRGTVRIEMHQTRWRWQADPAGSWNDEPVDVPERDTLFRLQADAFLDAVEGRAAVACPLAEAARTLATTRAILRSIERGRWESVEEES